MKRLVFIMIFSGLSMALFAQSVGINPNGSTPNPSAMLDVQANDKGMLIPRMTTDQRNAIVSPATGLMIYNLDDSCFNYYAGSRWILDCGSSQDSSRIESVAFGGSGLDRGEHIDVDNQGNIYVAGIFDGTLNLGDTTFTNSVTNGLPDIFITKISPSGQVLWAIQGSGPDGLGVNGIVVDAAGNTHVCGVVSSSLSFGSQTINPGMYVLKISPNGQILWTATANVQSAADLALDGVGNCYVAGAFAGSVAFGTQTVNTNDPNLLARDIYIARLTPSGSWDWAMSDGGNLGATEVLTDISTDAAGNCVVGGYTQGAGGLGNVSLNSAYFLAKYTASGQFLWAVPMIVDDLYDVVQDGAGNAYVTGYFSATATFGTFSLTSSNAGNNFDVFVAKVSSSGSFEWANAYGTSTFEEGVSISADGAGNIFVAGGFDNQTTYGTTTLTASGGSSVYALKIDPMGQVLWARTAGGSGVSDGYGITNDAQGNAYVTGDFSGNVIFGESNLSSQGTSDMFTWPINGQTGGPLFQRNSLFSSKQADNLGDHLATQTLDLNGNDLTNGDTMRATAFIGNGAGLTNIALDDLGNHEASQTLNLNGNDLINGDTITAVAFLGNGAGLTNVPGDNLGNHLATQTLDLNGNNLTNGGTLTAMSFIGNGAGLTNVPGDNLGNHLATQNLQLAGNWLSHDGDNEGLFVSTNGSIGINANTPAPSAVLDVQATDKGILIPRMISTNRTTIVNPVEGLMVYDSTTHSFWYYQQGWRELGVNTSTRLQDADQDTYIAVEQNPDEDIIRINAKGREVVRVDTLNTFLKTNLFAGRTIATNAINIVNFQSASFNALGISNPGWQAFTASSGGRLDFIEIVLATPAASSYMISIYEGVGTSGNIPLSTATLSSPTSSAWNPINFPDEVILKEGVTYTIGFNTIFNIGFYLGQYPNAPSILGGGDVFLLRVNLFPESYTINFVGNKIGIGTQQPDTTLHVVGQFQYQDNNQALGRILTSDANGMASWQAPFGDNLGNHTASQNVVLGGNWLSGDGDNEGLRIDPTGQVRVNGSLRIAPAGQVVTYGNNVLNIANTEADGFGSPTGGIGFHKNLAGGFGHAAIYTDGIGGFNGSLVFATDGDGIKNSNPTEKMRIRYDGNVGIGTSTPQNKLDIEGGLAVGTAYAGNSSITSPANGAIIEGNVGIGTTSPQHRLDLGSTVGRKLALYQNAAGTALYGFGALNDNVEIYAGSAGSANPPQMVINANGNVGIGLPNSSPTPVRGKLEIEGVAAPHPINLHGFLSTAGASTNTSANNSYSIYATGAIAGSDFNAFSDKRIKTIIGVSDSEADLSTLMQIEVTDYRLRDSIAKGTRPYKKVIAQQVAEVYPQAVTTTLTEVVPDIYQRATVQDRWIMLTTDLQVGERVKLITKQSAAVYEVSAVESERFQVWEPASQNASLDLADSTTVFVYGREVDDFHTVDYEAISMLNVSATQAQQKLIGSLQALLEEQQITIQSQQAQIEALEANQQKTLELVQLLQAQVQQLDSAQAQAVISAQK
ncbi:MAG: tail fiber domain-containing protein [Bacteroidota bacterium]